MSTFSVLVVEDEAIVAADLAGKLQQLGYLVVGTASTGEQAIRLARQHRPSLVLMDIRLAGPMDGITAAETIRQACDLPVIFLTAHSDDATLDRAKVTEAFGYIVKPFEERELRTGIEMALYKHQAERQLREQREWLRVTLHSIGDAVIATDAGRRITFLNSVAAALTGWSEGEALGQPVQQVLRLVDDQTDQAADDIVERVLSERRAVRMGNHTGLLARDGRKIPIEDSAAPIIDRGGDVTGVVIVFHDVTERRAAQQAQQESEQRFKLLAGVSERLLRAENPQGIIEDLCRDVMDHLDCDGFFNYFADEAGQRLRLNAWAGVSTGQAAQLESLDYGEAICGAVARDGTCIVVGDLQHQDDPRAALVKSLGLQAYTSHPLLAEGRVIGTLSFGTKSRPRFTAAELDLIKSVADQVAVAMGRLQAERARQTHLARLNRLIQVAEEVLAETSMPALMQRMVDAAEAMTDARMGVCGHGFREGTFEVAASSRRTDRSPCPPGAMFTMERGGVYQELLRDRNSIRYTRDELLTHPDWWGLPEGHAPLNGLLGARLLGRAGKPLGIIMVSDKATGEFTAEDEALLAQLAALASIGMEHLEARQEAERRASELATTFDAMSEAVIIYNREGLPVGANPAALRVCGFDPVGVRPAEFIRRLKIRQSDGKRLRVEELPCQQALAGEPIRGMRLNLTDAGGRELTVLASSSPLPRGPDLLGSVCVWHDVTERERLLAELEHRVEERTADLQSSLQRLKQEMHVRAVAEAALRESEERYRTLFDDAPVGIVTTDFRGRIHHANQAACAMFGVPADLLETAQVKSFYANPAERARLLSDVRRLGRVESRELTLQRLDGARFDGAVRMSRVELSGRRMLLSIVQDLTSKKKAARHNDGVARLLELFATKSSRREYLNAVVRLLREWCQCGGVGIRLVDADRCLPYAASVGFSRRFLRAEGEMCLDDDECPCLRVLQGRPRSGECPHESGSFFCNHMSHFLSQFPVNRKALKKVPCVEARFESIAHVPIRFHDEFRGSIHLTDRRAHHFTPEVAEFIGAIAPLVGEALHRFQVEEDLRESEQRFRSMFEKHDAIMFLTDLSAGLIVDANPAAARFYRCPRERLQSLKLRDLGIGLPALVKSEPRAERIAEWERFETTTRLPDGAERQVELHSSVISVQRRRLLFSIIQDVTERKQLQRQIIEAAEMERQRIGRDLHDSLGGLLTGVALMSKALAQALAEEGNAAVPVAEEVVSSLNEGVACARAIAHGLCPIEPGEFGLIRGLYELALNVRRRTGVACHLRASQRIRLDDPAAASHLFRIVEEAVQNALRHAQARHIGIRLTRVRDGVALRVWNDGKPLPREIDTSKGFGLRTMHYRADMIGAHLKLERAPGGGTAVSCLLPDRTPPQRKNKPGRAAAG